MDPAFRARFAAPGGGGGLPPYRLVAVTGASAGNINSLLSVVEWCRPGRPEPPERSLFWQVWIPTGLDQLFSDDDREHGNDHALFRRDFFERVHYPEIRKRLASDARVECADTLGIPVGVIDPGHAAPRVIYVDPDQLRGALAERRREPSVPRDAAGIDRLLLAMRGAVRSARQYELHALYRSMARDTSYARPEWLRVTSRSTPIVGEHLYAFAAFLDEDYAVECDGLPISEALVCANGFADLIRRFATPSVRATIQTWTARPECRARGIDVSLDCEADRTLRSLIRHPEGFSNEILRRLVHQLWRIEAGHAGHRSHKNLTEFLELSYRSVARRYSPGWDLDPSSVPDGVPARWAWTRVLPYHLAATAGQSGVEIGYRPMFHFGPRLGAVAHLIPLQFNAHEKDNSQNTDHSYLGAGAGIAYKNNGLSWSGFDATAIAMLPWSSFAGEERQVAGRKGHLLGGEVTSYFLGGKVRASLRVLPGNGDRASNIQGGERWAMTFGLADVNGLMYWLLR
jgi:hypothetical protein